MEAFVGGGSINHPTAKHAALTALTQTVDALGCKRLLQTECTESGRQRIRIDS
jgi:hypothetical protein